MKTQDIQALLDGATPGPWAYRPEDFDDWGVVRAERFHVCQAKDYRFVGTEIEATARKEKYDPWEGTARLVAAAPALAADLIAANAEIERLREALDQIAHCSAYTRHGGASEGDLGSYEKGLDTAIEIAVQALEAKS